MQRATPKAKKRKRSPRGLGRLFKKVGSRQVSADSPASGNYYLTYYVNGKRFTVALRDINGNPITDRKQAESARKRILAPYAAGTEIESLKAIKAQISEAVEEREIAVEQNTMHLAIADAWGAFMAHPNRPQCSERTLDQYESEFKRFKAWMDSKHSTVQNLRDITAEHATEYAADLAAAKLSASTFNQHRNFLAMLCRILQDTAHIEDNPFEHIKRRKLNKLTRRKRALEPQEYEAALAAASADHDLRDLFIMLAWTGQRLVDIVKMRWRAVDFQSGILTLYPQKTATRNGKAVHPPLFPAAREVLNRRQNTGKAFKLEAFVFPSLAQEYETNRTGLVKRITKTLESAGLETSAHKAGGGRKAPQYGAHSFRHFFVTQAAAAGMPGAIIKQITGHATDDMVEHYQHIGATFSAELASRIGGPVALPERVPLPDWARELAETLTTRNVKTVKLKLLRRGEE